MGDQRRRKRHGRHASVAGDPAEEVFDGLVDQFADPYAFVRELIQNSLDAGSSRIDVQMRFEGRTLEVAVRDDGEGMDREIIEGYLLTLFRSTKDKDLTKIGKFGIGFVSIFALGPREVVIDTGRDGIWHRVVFDAEREYTLLRLPDPYEGTTVTLRLDRAKARAAEDCVRIEQSAVRWCRFAEAEILTSAEGVANGWAERPIRAPFTVEAPITVEEQGDGFHAVLGPCSGTPSIGFYNRGLTLWEASEAMVPGVSFRVRGRHLEHTLTRDNVLRDRHFTQVVDRLRALARTRLGDAVHDEAVAAAASGDLPRLRRLFSAIGQEVPWSWKEDLPILPAAGRAPACLREVRPFGGRVASLFGQRQTVMWAPPGSRVGEMLAGLGTLVLLADTEHDRHLAWLGAWLRLVPQPAEQLAWCPRPAEGPPEALALVASMADLARSRDRRARVHAGVFAGGGAALKDRFAVAQREPFAAELADPVDNAGEPELVVDVEHPLFARLLALPVDVAAPLGLRAAALASGRSERLPPDLVDRAVWALREKA